MWGLIMWFLVFPRLNWWNEMASSHYLGWDVVFGLRVPMPNFLTNCTTTEAFSGQMSWPFSLSGGIFSKNVMIRSDIHITIRSLIFVISMFVLFHECWIFLKKIPVNSKIILYWVQGHRYIAGNRIASELTRSGAEHATSNISQRIRVPIVSITLNIVHSFIWHIGLCSSKRIHEGL